MAAGKRSAAARKTAGIKGKRITAKQRVARVKNIAVARSYKKKGKGDKFYIAKAIIFDKRVSVSRGIGSAARKATYKKAFKKSYKSNPSKSKLERSIAAHESAYKKVTGRSRQMRSKIKWF